MKNFLSKKVLSRILIGGIYLIYALLLIVLRNNAFATLAIGIISLIAVYEYFQCVNLDKTFFEYFGYFLTITSSLILYSASNRLMTNHEITGKFSQYILLYINMIVIIIFIYNILKNMQYNIKELALVLFGYIYTILLPIYILRMYFLPNGNLIICYLLVITMSTDTFAYIFGRMIGKIHFTSISPKKTIEGSIAGIIFSMIFTILYLIFLKYIMKSSLDFYSYVKLGIFSLIFSIISQLGDLVASMIKRSFNKKDFSRLLQEHGGILDRFDSLLFISSVAYTLFSYGVLNI